MAVLAALSDLGPALELEIEPPGDESDDGGGHQSTHDHGNAMGANGHFIFLRW